MLKSVGLHYMYVPAVTGSWSYTVHVYNKFIEIVLNKIPIKSY